MSFGGVGCGSDYGDGQPEKLRDDIPDPVEGGAQIVSPTFLIPPGEEVFMCMKIPHVVDHTWYVGDTHVYQSNNGHHTLLYYASGSTAGVETEPHRCDGLDMTNVRMVTTGAGNGSGLIMPDGVAMEVPEGAELWAQSHYINASDEERLVQDVINLELVPEEQVTDVASTFSHVDLTFSVPPNQEYTKAISCVMEEEMRVPWMIPHMHEWGKEYKITIERGEEEIYKREGQWTAAQRNDFPIELFEEPLVIEPGDVLTTECTWNNTENTPLLWPQEMCVTFFPFYPGDGTLIACDESGDIFVP